MLFEFLVDLHIALSHSSSLLTPVYCMFSVQLTVCYVNVLK